MFSFKQDGVDMMLSDEELLVMIAEDNEQAFRMLYERYWKRMLIKAYNLLRSHDLAEEVVQDAFINMWKRRHTLLLRNSFHTYISAVVKYEVMSKLALRFTQPLYLDDMVIAPAQDHSTQQWLDFDELYGEIQQTINTLPEKCQLVFRLSREEGLTARQISESLQISPKTVEAHISKALRTLRISLSSFFI